MGRRFALLIIVLLLPALAGAQEPLRDWNRVDDPLNEGIGLQMGLSSGIGLSWKFPLRWWLQAQLSGGIWNDRDDKRHNVGLELQYVLRQYGSDRLYLGAGMAYFYHRHAPHTWDHVNLGFGVGLERLRGERTALQIAAMFTYQGDKETVLILPSAGFHYYF